MNVAVVAPTSSAQPLPLYIAAPPTTLPQAASGTHFAEFALAQRLFGRGVAPSATVMHRQLHEESGASDAAPPSFSQKPFAPPGRSLKDVIASKDFDSINAKSLSESVLLSLLTSASDASGDKSFVNSRGEIVRVPDGAAFAAPYRLHKVRQSEKVSVELSHALFTTAQVMDTPVHPSVLNMLWSTSPLVILLNWLGDLKAYEGKVGEWYAEGGKQKSHPFASSRQNP